MAFDFSQDSGLIFIYLVRHAGLNRCLCPSLVIRFLLLSLKLRDLCSHPCLLIRQFFLLLRLQFFLFLCFQFFFFQLPVP